MARLSSTQWVAAILVAGVLAFPIGAGARPATMPAKAIDVVTFIAGHQTSIVCDPTLGGHAATSPDAFGWAAYGGNIVYLVPAICQDMSADIGSPRFAEGIAAVIHEAAHARGARSESCAEMTADLGVFDALRRFYGVPFFSDLSRTVGDQVLAGTRLRPESYQPEECWNGAYE